MSRASRCTAWLSIAAVAAAGSVLPPAAAAADPIGDGQWYVGALRLDAAHRISTGKGVVVAVIDTGVDATHPDLAGSVVAGFDVSRRPSGEGLTDLVGHGTAMAGLIVGHGRTRGVAPGATVMSIRAESGGGGSPSDIGVAINRAVTRQVDVISVSLAAGEGGDVMRQAVQAALRNDIVIVAGAGNTETNSGVGYPAAYEGVIAVGGTGRDGTHSAAAVTGDAIVLSAPCEDISTPYVKHQWAVGTGTSNSAALVAGAAALVRARFPGLSAREVAHRLTATAVDKGAAGRDGRYGYGVIDVLSALTAEVTPLPPPAVASDVAPPVFSSSVPLAAPGSRPPLRPLHVIVVGSLLMAAAALVLLRRRRRR